MYNVESKFWCLVIYVSLHDKGKCTFPSPRVQMNILRCLHCYISGTTSCPFILGCLVCHITHSLFFIVNLIDIIIMLQ